MSATALAMMALALFLAADRYDRPVGTGYTNPWIVCGLWGAFTLCLAAAAGVQIAAVIP